MAGSQPRGKLSYPLSKRLSECVDSLRAAASRPPLLEVIGALKADSNPHVVGGAIRDLLEEQTPTDFDLAVGIEPPEVVRRLANASVRVIETGLHHGTVMAVVEEAHIEITTFRVPGQDSGHYSSSIEEDLAGRDFTINALAFDIRQARLLDPFNGAADLDAGVVRAVGDPTARFREDALRILRAVRFGPAAGRVIESRTAAAAREGARELRKISAERIRVELEKILLGEARAGFEALHQLGILEEVLPETLPSIDFAQNDFHTEDVFRHTLSVIERTPPERILRWTALFHDLGKPATLSTDAAGRRHFYRHEEVSTDLAKQVMERLKFSIDDQRAISLLVRHHMRPIECGPAGVRRLFRDLGTEFQRWRTFKLADAPPVMTDGEVQERLTRFDAMVTAEETRRLTRSSQLTIDGNDLIAIGMVQGKALGDLLKKLEELVIEDPELNERDILLQRAKELLSS